MTESSYGYWWDPTFPEERVAGRLTYEPLQAPELSLLEAPPAMWAGHQSSPAQGVALQNMRVPMLHGLMADQGAVTLLHCQWHGMTAGATQTHKMRAARALIGVWLDDPDEKLLRRVEVDLPALEALLGQRPVSPKQFPKTQSKQVRFSLERRRRSWDDGVTQILWEYKPGMSIDRLSAEVQMTPTVVLTSATPRSLNSWIDEWIAPINQLVAVMAGSKSSPRAISAWQKKNLRVSERGAARLAVWGRGVGPHTFEFESRLALADATAVDLNTQGLHGVVSRFRQLAAEHEVFLGLLDGAIRFPDRPRRNRYLDLTGALEAYHSKIRGLGPVAPDKFKTARKAALDAAKTAGTPSTHVKFLRRWLAGRSEYPLEHRLRELATFVGVLGRWSVEPRRMAALRNDVAHGNANLDPFQLRSAHDQALDLSRRLVLHELGMVGN